MDAVEPLRLRAVDGPAGEDPQERTMWHITLTVAGVSVRSTGGATVRS